MISYQAPFPYDASQRAISYFGAALRRVSLVGLMSSPLLSGYHLPFAFNAEGVIPDHSVSSDADRAS